jgi:hypothetical protein
VLFRSAVSNVRQQHCSKPEKNAASVVCERHKEFMLIGECDKALAKMAVEHFSLLFVASYLC